MRNIWTPLIPILALVLFQTACDEFVAVNSVEKGTENQWNSNAVIGKLGTET